MRTLRLKEYEPSDEKLSGAERKALFAARSKLHLTVEPTEGGAWRLTPGSTVGALEVTDGLRVLIQPKIDIGRVLFLASYALDEFRLFDPPPDFAEQEIPTDALARLFAAAARRAFSRGILRGYRTEEEALITVRGRIRFVDQIRRRFNVPLPVEVRYDEHTQDILANRLVKAAALRLASMPLGNPASAAELRRIAHVLGEVAVAEFAPDRVPTVTFDRLKDHYREVVGLARLILSHGTVELDHGRVRASGFLMDMDAVFEKFVRRALREALGATRREFPEARSTHLDTLDRIRLEPDLSWWKAGPCRFVGDVKYKNLSGRQHPPNADLYQLLAYATALDLPGGMLIYANGEAAPATHVVRHAGKQLEVRTLDLAGQPSEILGQIKTIADRIRVLAAQAAPHPAAA